MAFSKYPNPAKGPETKAPEKPAGQPPQGGPTGRVVHDSRGNAVWDWLAQTSRLCIESTSALLKKLHSSELKMEDTQNEKQRLTSDGKCAGGGYDPYSKTETKPRKPMPAKK